MSTSPNFSEHWAHLHSAPDNAATSSRGTFMGVDARWTERRRRPPPAKPEEQLHAMPGLILLDHVSIPMLATGLDGVVVYTNAAFATMLGHRPDTIMLIGQSLPALLAGHSATPAHECVSALRAAGNAVIDWRHIEGFPVRSVISDALFFSGTDQLLLIGITDVTELIWTAAPEAS